MGQVERYGVFALCVVIFLILGIAIWGGGGPTVPAAAGEKTVPQKAGPASGSPLDLMPEQREPKTQGREEQGGTFEPPPPKASGAGGTGGGGAAEPAPAPTRTYRIRSNDTLSRIAARELGDKRKVDAILALNPGLDALKLRLNQEITLPAAAGPGGAPAKAEAPTATRPKPAGKESGKPDAGRKIDPASPAKDPTVKVAAKSAGWPKHYKVEAGDKLASIARRFYGDDRKSTFLAKANGIKDQDRVRAGTLLTIPAVD